MATIASLLVKVGIDKITLSRTSKSLQSFAKTSTKTFKSMSKKISSSIGGMAKTLKKAFTGLGGIIAGLGASLSVAGLVTTIATVSKSAKELLNISNAIGVSVKSITEWSAAAKSVGIEAEKMNDILKDSADKIGDFIVTGGGEAKDIFERLNLNVKEFVNLSSGDALLKIGQAMSSLTNKEQVFLMESLADEASRLLPLFENNAQAYKAAIDEAVKSGNILTRSQADSAASFSKSLQRLTARITGFGKHLTIQLSKPFSLMIDWINQAIDRMGGIDAVAKKVASGIISGIGSIIKTGGEIFKFFSKIKIALLEIKLQAQKTAKSISLISVAEAGGKLLDKDFKINIFGDTSKTFKEIQDLKKGVEGFDTGVDKYVDSKIKTLIDAIGGSGNNDLIKQQKRLVKEQQAATNSINRLGQSALKSSKAIDPKIKKNAKVIDFADQSSRIAAQQRNFNVSGGRGFSGFRGSKSSGIFKDELPQGKIGSLQDYINTSPAGKALQDLRRGAFGRNSGIKTGFINGKQVDLQKDSFNGKSGSLLDKLLKSEPMTKVTLEWVTDTGKVAGEIFAEPKFVSDLKSFNEKQTNQAARAATV